MRQSGRPAVQPFDVLAALELVVGRGRASERRRAGLASSVTAKCKCVHGNFVGRKVTLSIHCIHLDFHFTPAQTFGNEVQREGRAVQNSERGIACNRRAVRE